MIYNKLVRDKIPDLIMQRGERPNYRILDAEEYTWHLEMKLNEEVGEYRRDRNLEELADILEVAFSLAENLGYSRDELMAVCQQKHEERGGFNKRIYLVSKE